MRLSRKIDYGNNMDSECITLCDALNSVKGITTSGSCCGHDSCPFYIFFRVTLMKGLFFVTRCVDKRYWKHGHEWTIDLSVGDTIVDDVLPTAFRLQSEKVGEEARQQALDLVENMNNHLNHINFKKGFGLTFDDFCCQREAEGTSKC